MITMTTAMMINLLNGTKAIKNAGFKKQRLRKNFCLLLGTHQGGGIDVCQETRKKRQKNYGGKYRLFLCFHQKQKIFMTIKFES